MKILLINNNPVVSRLTALSARKEEIEIDEIQEVTELSSNNYDIVFVDGDSWTKDVQDVIRENIKVQKRVLFYADGDNDEKENFDLSILKPFLPSEVSAVIRSVEEGVAVSEVVEDKKDNDNKDDLFNLDDLEDEVISVSTKDSKEIVDDDVFANLLDESVEKSKVNNFDEKLEEAFPLTNSSLDDDLFSNDLESASEEKREKEKLEKVEELEEDKIADLFELDLDDDLDSDSSDNESKEKELDDKKIDEKKIDEQESKEREELLLLDDKVLESEEVEKLELSETTSTKTKILDVAEIDNIKGLLSEDASNDMVLEDIMPAMTVIPNLEKVDEKESSNQKENSNEKEKVSESFALEVETKSSKKKKTKKLKEPSKASVESNLLIDTLIALPTDKLKELLSGAKINISIKFPKVK